ncbi:MAG: cytochrome-c peroxidase [Phycisphaerae bacterium]|nr:cytochrome-c peroxidase [Phycisphaerae bacterium]
MKKKPLIIIACMLAGVLLLAIPVINLFYTLPATPEFEAIQAETPAMETAKMIIANKCLMCHADNPSLPYYAKWPIASGVIAKDIEGGTAMADFTELFENKGLDEIQMAKLEQAIRLNTMPPSNFMALHWNGSLTAKENEAVLAWVREVRARHFATGLADAAHANDAVQPLPAALPVVQAKVELGQKLFHDVRLSGDNTISCSSCHDLAKGGTDNAQFSTGVRGQLGGINAPTCFNAVFNVLQFWDGRAEDLADQAGGPPLNPIEMDSSWEQITGKLALDEALTAEYKAAYGGSPWEAENIKDAIAEFEKTLITPDSKLDRYLKGDSTALSPAAQHGYALFQSHSCATCHAGKAMGGLTFEKPIHPDAFFSSRKRTPKEPDLGRFNATNDEAHRYKQKVPTLRNIALTFPYLHHGSTSDLKEVVRLMHDHFVPKANRKPLSDKDIDEIVEMLESNTGVLNGKQL